MGLLDGMQTLWKIESENGNVSVVIRVPAENRWLTRIRVLSEEVNKETPYKGTGGTQGRHPLSRKREQSLDATSGGSPGQSCNLSTAETRTELV